MTDHDGSAIAYTRDAEGRATREDYTDGSNTVYTYDAVGEMLSLREVTAANVTRRSITYAYDDNGNLRSEQRTGVDIDKRDEAVSYTYDNGNRLISMTLNGKTTRYTYDKAGNLTSDGTTTYTYGQQNRLLSKTGADGTTSYTYDTAGNLTKETTPDGTIDYTYNAQNRLTLGERSDGQSSAYVYNAMGARVENTQVRENKNAAYQSNDLIDGSHGTDYKDFLSDQRATWQRVWETEVGTTVQNNYETVTQRYIVDYLSLANRDIMVTEDGSWTQRYVYDQSGTRISAEYTHADGTKRGTTNADGEYGENFQSDTAVDEVGKVYFRTSPLGSTLFAIDADGETVSHTIYDPWGKPLTETYIDANFSGLDNVNNYTGYTWDEVLGLYYAQARLYDADANRFTQEDPIKSGKNWYAYCGDNPLVRMDPTGEEYGRVIDFVKDLELIFGKNSQAETYVWSGKGKNKKVTITVGSGYFMRQGCFYMDGRVVFQDERGNSSWTVSGVTTIGSDDRMYIERTDFYKAMRINYVIVDIYYEISKRKANITNLAIDYVVNLALMAVPDAVEFIVGPLASLAFNVEDGIYWERHIYADAFRPDSVAAFQGYETIDTKTVYKYESHLIDSSTGKIESKYNFVKRYTYYKGNFPNSMVKYLKSKG